MENTKTQAQFFKIDVEKSTPILHKRLTCPRCGNLIDAPDTHHKWVKRCSVCASKISFFHPTQIQKEIILDNRFFIANFSGKGLGKTTADACKVFIHVTKFSNARVNISAQTLDQLNKAVKPEIEKFFLDDEFITKNKDIWVLKNNSTILFTPSDAQTIRSHNFSLSLAVEASGISPEYIKELKQRTRYEIGAEYETDEKGNIVFTYNEKTKIKKAKLKKAYNQVIIESNPDKGYIRSEIVWKAKEVHYTQSVANINKLKLQVVPEEEGAIVYIGSSVDNPFVSDKWLAAAFAGMSEAEINIHKYCDFTYEEGLVFPGFEKHIVEPFVIPSDASLIMSYDIGYNDPDGILWLYLDFLDNVVYVVDYHYKRFQSVRKTGIEIKQKELNNGWKEDNIILRVMDTQGKQVNKQNEGDSVAKQLKREAQLDFVFSTKDINLGIRNMQSAFEEGRLKIFSSVSPLISELREYEWNPNATLKGTPKPKSTQSDHLIDALRYGMMTLQFNDGFLGISPKYGSRSRSSFLEEKKYYKTLKDEELNKRNRNAYNALNLWEDLESEKKEKKTTNLRVF